MPGKAVWSKQAALTELLSVGGLGWLHNAHCKGEVMSAFVAGTRPLLSTARAS
jgi:hypothetical protein